MIQKQFLQMVIPSMIAFAFSGIYAIVDGIFIGQNVGDAGLAAINIAYPLTALLQAVGIGIGMGGAIHIAISVGRKDSIAEREYLGNAFVLLAGACMLVTVLLLLLYRPLLTAFGASGTILMYCCDYMRIIALGAALQILSTGLVPLVRNYNGALVAMLSMVAGFMTNIVLDWLFVEVFGKGTAGAALATILGQGVTCIPCLLFLATRHKFVRDTCYSLRPQRIRGILRAMLSPFGLTMTPNLIILVMNKAAVVFGSDLDVACYAVISYAFCVVQLLLQGIGDGAQPLIGRLYGSGNTTALRQVRLMAYLLAAGTALMSVLLLYLLRNVIPHLFGASTQVATLYVHTLPYFLLGILPIAFLRITTSYFYAIDRNHAAYVLIYGEPALLTLLVTFTFPHFWEMDGVWLSSPISNCLLVIMAVILLLQARKQ